MSKVNLSGDTLPGPIEFRKCGCGCDAAVAGKSNFKPGHDARLVSHLVKVVMSKTGLARLDEAQTAEKITGQFSPALQAKFQKAWGNAEIREKAAANKPARPARQGNAKAAKADRVEGLIEAMRRPKTGMVGAVTFRGVEVGVKVTKTYLDADGARRINVRATEPDAPFEVQENLPEAAFLQRPAQPA